MLQFIIGMVVHALHERMARRVDYLQEEVRVLREVLGTATGKSRIGRTTVANVLAEAGIEPAPERSRKRT